MKPTPVIKESTKILSGVQAENLAERYNQKSPKTPLASPPEHCTQATASLAAAAARPTEQSVAPNQDIGETLQEFSIKLFPCQKLNTYDSMKIL